jgi:signal peptidase II
MWLWLTAVAVLAADLISKAIATRALNQMPGRRFSVVPGTMDFYLQENTGAAFSILRGHPEIITIFSVIAVIFITVWALKLPRNVISAQIAFGMIIGGAVGNLIDRVRLGYVVDFIHVYYREWAFPTFNIADSGISVGIGIFLFLSLFTKKLDAPAKPAEEAPASHEESAPSDTTLEHAATRE